MYLSKDHWLLCRPIAHRGIHNKEAPENTFSAFQNAIDQNSPIELDIQVLKDGEIVVFHDFDLKRMCNIKKDLSQLTIKELNEIKITKKDNIPTLKDTLRFINNQVPILIEIKNEKLKNKCLHENTLEVLKEYNGEIAIQSFNPMTIRYF